MPWLKIHAGISLPCLIFLVGCGTTPTSDSQRDHSLLGNWYIQCLHSNQEMGLTFEDEGEIHFHEDGRLEGVDRTGERFEGTYELDRDRQIISLSMDAETGFARYWVGEDTLLFSMQDDPPRSNEKLTIVELSRFKDGSPRQQAFKRLSTYELLPIQEQMSDDNLRVIIKAVMKQYEKSGKIWPSSLGTLAMDGKIELDRLFAPWSEYPLPDQFEELSRQRQERWLSAYSSYVYLPKYEDIQHKSDPALVIFEIPLTRDVKNLGLAFSDGTIRRLPNADASELLKQHTGETLDVWWQVSH